MQQEFSRQGFVSIGHWAVGVQAHRFPAAAPLVLLAGATEERTVATDLRREWESSILCSYRFANPWG
jgi:hypothetical protein